MKNLYFSDFIIRIKSNFVSSSARSKKITLNVILSSFGSGISLLTSLLIVPLTINYVNPTQYGIWMALSSVIGWISVVNLGLGNGFRNKYAEAKAKKDIILARQYLSTTYFAISCIILSSLLIIHITNTFLDWSSILKISPEYKNELRDVFGIVATFFCLNMVLRLFNTMLIADQNPGFASLIDTIGNLCSLLAIYLLSRFTTGSLYNLALYFSGIPCLVILIASIIAFMFSKYKIYAPSLFYVRFSLVKDILNLGIKFFIIQICIIATFQIINIVISREIGPTAVTQYNISYKYFYVLYTMFSIIVSPYWSAFTDAYVQNDYHWMKNSIKTLEKCCILAFLLGILMLVLSDWFYTIWIGDSVDVPFLLSLQTMLLVLSLIIANTYMLPINGIGTLKIQLIVFVFSALSSWFFITIACRLWGLYGIAITPMIIYILQAIMGKVQITKILNKKASGIWMK